MLNIIERQCIHRIYSMHIKQLLLCSSKIEEFGFCTGPGRSLRRFPLIAGQVPALEEGWFVKAKGESATPVFFSTATTVYPIIP